MKNKSYTKKEKLLIDVISKVTKIYYESSYPNHTDEEMGNDIKSFAEHIIDEYKNIIKDYGKK